MLSKSQTRHRQKSLKITATVKLNHEPTLSKRLQVPKCSEVKKKLPKTIL